MRITQRDKTLYDLPINCVSSQPDYHGGTDERTYHVHLEGGPNIVLSGDELDRLASLRR
jgi:hypothetical protein